jgi:hypothetical protein
MPSGVITGTSILPILIIQRLGHSNIEGHQASRRQNLLIEAGQIDSSDLLQTDLI